MVSKAVLGIAIAVVIVAAVLGYYLYEREAGGGPALAHVTMSTGETIEIPTDLTGSVMLYTSIPDLTGSVMLYTSIPQEIMDGWIKDWNTYFSNFSKLDYYRAGSGSVVAKILAEQKAGSIKADVVYLAGYFDFKTLQDNGLIAKIPSVPEMQYIPNIYKDPNGYYVMGRLLVMVIVYNPALVSNPPRSWQELLQPNGRTS
ncbi:MAG: extracellular solute-binding protein [Fervidicoccaceae archaeon]